MRQKVTGIVLSNNGENFIEKNLSSMDFCDHLLAVDCGSTDRTVEMAKAMGAEVVYHKFEGAIPQYRFALSLVRTPWVFVLDQDEHLTPEAKDSLINAIENPGDNVGFYLSRMSFYLDRFMRHGGWYPDRLMRLFRIDGMEVRGVAPHQEFWPKGKTSNLSGDIIHYPYNDLAGHITKINTYTSASSRDLYSMGKRATLATAFSHGIWRFFRHYLLKLGFLDGKAGLIMAVNSSFYVFLKYVKLYELGLRNDTSPKE